MWRVHTFVEAVEGGFVLYVVLETQPDQTVKDERNTEE